MLCLPNTILIISYLILGSGGTPHIFDTFVFSTSNSSSFCCILNFIGGHFWSTVLKLLYNCLTMKLFTFRLLTPPGTPLFPSLDVESKRSPVSQVGTPKTRPTALKSRVGYLIISCTLVLRSTVLLQAILLSSTPEFSKFHLLVDIYETILSRE